MTQKLRKALDGLMDQLEDQGVDRAKIAEAGAAYLFDLTADAVGLNGSAKARIAEAETPADLAAILDAADAAGQAEIERRKLVNQTADTISKLLRQVFVNTLFKLLP